MNGGTWKTAGIAAAAAIAVCGARADEKHFAFVKEPRVTHEGEREFEQWITGRFGRDEGTYARWDIREEFEYGFTDFFSGALYLNFTDIHTGREEAEDKGLDFTGISTEFKLQLSDPYTDVLGTLLYLEYTTDGASHELEEKFVIGKEWDLWTIAADATVEQEWEDEDGGTEKESALLFGLGVSRKLGKEWSAGVEAVQKFAHHGLGLDDEEYSTTSAGPNLHFKRGRFYMTLAVLPQVHGTGDGADGGLQLAHAERVMSRLHASIEF